MAVVLGGEMLAHPSGLPAQERVSFPTQDGGLVYADMYGKGDHGVVLAHGGGFTKESWENQARALAAAGFRVLAIDFRGYGQSRGPGQSDPLSAPLHLDVLAAVRYLRQTGAETVSVVGGSMGGGAAADASIEAEPGEVDRLVLLAALAGGPPERIKGRKLFITARNDTTASGAPRLIRIREQYERAPDPGSPIAITGAWRPWFEHPARRQTQGGTNPFSPDNTNPDHSFEIHPISRVNHDDVGRSFIPIPHYQAYTADVAFPYFDSCVITVKASASGISIRSKKLKYNYVQFEIELVHDPKEVQDGRIALATILNVSGEEAASGPRRMIFVGGTAAHQATQHAAAGDRLRVLGIPRIDLSGVLALVNKNGTAQFDAQLPYEMIIVGVL